MLAQVVVVVFIYRIRRCESPRPANGGTWCYGNDIDVQLCSTNPSTGWSFRCTCILYFEFKSNSLDYFNRVESCNIENEIENELIISNHETRRRLAANTGLRTGGPWRL